MINCVLNISLIVTIISLNSLFSKLTESSIFYQKYANKRVNKETKQFISLDNEIVKDQAYSTLLRLSINLGQLIIGVVSLTNSF